MQSGTAKMEKVRAQDATGLFILCPAQGCGIAGQFPAAVECCYVGRVHGQIGAARHHGHDEDALARSGLREDVAAAGERGIVQMGGEVDGVVVDLHRSAYGNHGLSGLCCWWND